VLGFRLLSLCYAQVLLLPEIYKTTAAQNLLEGQRFPLSEGKPLRNGLTQFAPPENESFQFVTVTTGFFEGIDKIYGWIQL